MEAFIAFFAKYWLTFIFGLVSAGLAAALTKMKKRYQTGKKVEQDQELEPFKKQILADVQELKEEVLGIVQEKEEEFEQEELNINNEMKQLHKEIVDSHKEIYHILEISREVSQGYRDLYQEGLLYNMRKEYFKDCKKLLDPEYVISFEDFSQISADHDLYNRLGGNHQGDIYFKAIQDKYHDQTH